MHRVRCSHNARSIGCARGFSHLAEDSACPVPCRPLRFFDLVSGSEYRVSCRVWQTKNSIRLKKFRKVSRGRILPTERREPLRGAWARESAGGPVGRGLAQIAPAGLRSAQIGIARPSSDHWGPISGPQNPPYQNRITDCTPVHNVASPSP